MSKRAKKDPGVPNIAPFKEEVLREAEQRRQQVCSHLPFWGTFLQLLPFHAKIKCGLICFFCRSRKKNKGTERLKKNSEPRRENRLKSLEAKKLSPVPKRLGRLKAPPILHRFSLLCFYCYLTFTFVVPQEEGKKKSENQKAIDRNSNKYLCSELNKVTLDFQNRNVGLGLLFERKVLSTVSGHRCIWCGDRSPWCSWPPGLSVSTAGGGSATKRRKQEAASRSKQNRWIYIYITVQVQDVWTLTSWWILCCRSGTKGKRSKVD